MQVKLERVASSLDMPLMQEAFIVPKTIFTEIAAHGTGGDRNDAVQIIITFTGSVATTISTNYIPVRISTTKMEDFNGAGIKQEALGTPQSNHQCQASHQRCMKPRSLMRDGTPHELCDDHRRQAKRADQQHKRLLRLLVEVMKSESEPSSRVTGSVRRRPRLVLLGNQQTLVLGVVLTQRGDLNTARRSML
jgi:hypothetical protein